MADQESDLSPKECQQLVMVLRCLKEGSLTNAMVDIPKFAKKAGLTTGSAKNVLIKIRKKLDDGEGEAGVDATPLATEGQAKKAPAKESPEKKPRAPRTKKEAKVQANEEDEEETA